MMKVIHAFVSQMKNAVSVMLRRVALVRTDISEERITSIIRGQESVC
jgi:hypothetical protein